MLSGVALNYVIWYTVVDMAKNFSAIPAINSTWEIVRDIANIGFIFLLLYAGIKTMLGQGGDVKKTVVNIVGAAILINFSLFITRVIIDAANVLAITFYSSIAPNAVTSTGAFDHTSTGLSNAFTSILNFQTLFQSGANLNELTILTVGIMGSLVLMIAAFAFLAVTIMFVIRYAVLILVMILSPIAFVAQVFPGMSKYGKQWWDALLGQAFFAPVYLFLTWIAIRLLQNMPFSTTDWATALNGTIEKSSGVANVSYASGSIELIIQFAFQYIPSDSLSEVCNW